MVRDLLPLEGRIFRVVARSAFLVLLAVALLSAQPAPAKALSRAVLVGSDGAWMRVAGAEDAFANLARDPDAKPRRARGGFVRLYFVGAGDFPANRARYYPRQRCIALDWPRYERSCVALNPKLVPLFRRSHGFVRFSSRPTVLARLSYLSNRSTGLAALTGSVELALLRKGVSRPALVDCYELAARWDGPAERQRPRRVSLCRSGVYADGRLHPLNGGAWKWFGLNVGPPTTPPAPEPPVPTQPSACGQDEIARLVGRFIEAFNDGELETLDDVFAEEPDFEWYSTDAPGERLELSMARDRASLLQYFEQRHALGERLTLKSLRFNGNTRGSRPYGNFEYTLTRSATDLLAALFTGKGAALCYASRQDQIFVWLMRRA